MASKRAMEPIAFEDYIEFRGEEFYANKIVDGEDMRVLAFAFKAGQEMDVVKVRPSVLLYAYRGQGFFTVGKREYPVGPGQFVVVAADEPHGVRAGRHEDFVALVVIAPSPTGMLE